MKPEISVIVPVYNVEKYIIQCLDSIRLQTFSEYEVLLIDDGGTDRSVELCEVYIEKHKLNSFKIIHQKNGGACEARNKGLSKAKGKWIFFTDGDDWLEPDCLQTLWNCAEHYPSDLVVGGYQAVDEQTKKVEVWSDYPAEQGEMPQGLSSLCSFGFCWGRLYKNEIIASNGLRFDARIKYAEDTAWNFDYNGFIKSFSATNEVVYNYRINRNGSETSKLVTPKMKYDIWEHMQGFLKMLSDDQIDKALKENKHLLSATWGVLSTAIVNDVLDKKYALAKEKIKSTLSKAVKKYYAPDSVKERIFMFMLKHSFLALRVFSVVYYGNFEVLRRSKILRIISKTK